MFKNEYQGGPYFEILTLQGKESSAHWKFSGGVKKVFDKEVKSYIYSLEGTTSTTKVHFPKDQSQAVPLIQRYLVIQLHLAKGQDLSIELGVSDLGNNKRRLLFSTAQKETQVTPLHAKVPLTILKRSIWLNMCIDMVSLVSETWRGQTYKATQSITVSANCKLRRIFTMKIQPPDTAGDEEMYGCPPSNSGELDQIPKSCQLASDVQQITQLLTLTKIRHGERLRGGSGDVNRASATLELDLNASGRRTSLNDSYHIAFGSKVPGGKSTSQNTSRKSAQGSMTNRSTRNTYSRMDSQNEEEHFEVSSSISSKDGLLSDHSRGEDYLPSHQRQGSDSLSQVDLEMMSRIDKPKQDFSLVQPHPPREPSSDRLRRKIRLKAGSGGVGKDRVSSAGSVTDETPSVGHSKHSQHSESGYSSYISSTSPHRKRLVSDGELMVSEENDNTTDPANRNRSAETVRGVKSQGMSDQSAGRTSNRFKGVGASGQDPYPRLSPKASKEYHSENYQEEGGEEVMDESMSNVIQLLKQNAGLGDRMGQDWDSLTDEEEESSAEDIGREEYEESDEEVTEKQVFFFQVLPKAAPRSTVSPSHPEGSLEPDQSRTPSLSKNSKKVSKELARGARPEEDFIDNNSSSEEDDRHLRKKLTGSRPNSGTNSRPHSGTNSRPHSGTNSRPHSGTNSRPHSGTQSGTNSRTHSGKTRNGTNNMAVSPKSGVEKKIPRTVLSPVQPQVANESPELRFNSNTSVLKVPGMMNNGHLSNSSVSRMSRKSLREIPMNDARLKSSEKPYDFSKYQMADITESFEAKMLSSMKRHNDEELEDVVESPRKQTAPSMPANKSPHSTQEHNPRNLYDFSPTLTSDDDTSLSTWQAPPNAPHNYQDEMKSRLSTDTLTSSNPRDWGMFSPPLPVFQNQLKSSNEDLSVGSNNPSPRKEPSDLSPRKGGLSAMGRQDTTDDESIDELDLLYDPCLNCYYDPRSCKYYELV
ncbi:protein CFAP20DC-like isoform X2 [Argopecten irradians]|uniref:protein CFAP20DC-like isoform X1 n=1 Tax=Argopecten irradians TaxID=31199 RepID=UPI0037229A7E